MFRMNQIARTSIIWIASLILVLGHQQAVSAGRPASILEIKELFDVAIARPDRCRFIAELLQTEPPATKAEIAGEVALQKEYMAKKGEPPMSPALHQEVVLARSNAIVQAKSGFRVQHVEEYYSGIYSRMNITDEATVMPSFLRSNRSSYHDSYVNIHNPEFSPYASFTANHELHSAMLTKESDRYYRMSDLWRAVTIDQPLELPLVLALGDLKSLATNRLDGSNKFDADALLSSLRIDSWNVERLHNGSDLNWRLDATDTQVDGLSAVLFKLQGKYPDPRMPLPLSTIESLYWIGHIAGRVVCIQGMLTNSTLHSSFFSKRGEYNTNGFPHSWTTSTTRAGVVKGCQVKFKALDLHPSFSDLDIFAPRFSSNYIVSDVTSGTGVILQQPGPRLPIRSPMTSSPAAKRMVVLVVFVLIAIIPLLVARKLRHA